MSLPILTVIGNIQKIETKQISTDNGVVNITNMNISCGEKNKSGNYDNLYIKAGFFKQQSDFVSQYFKEGDIIIVTGKLITESYTKQDGTKVYETKFQYPQASFVPKAKEAPQQEQYKQPQPSTQYNTSQQAESGTPVPEIDIDSDEIPF